MLFAAVRIPSPKVRITAVQTLLMHDHQPARIVPVLADLIRDSEDGVRAEATSLVAVLELVEQL